jgi:hypothetical protein
MRAKALFACAETAEVSLRLPEGRAVGASREVGIIELDVVVLPKTDLANNEGSRGLLIESLVTATRARELVGRDHATSITFRRRT